MKKEQSTWIKTIIVLALTLSLIACASEPKMQSGFLKDYQKNMAPGPEGGAKLRWLEPGVDFGKYNKVMLDSVIFYLADDSEYKGIDPAEMKELADAFNLDMVNALKDKYPIVSDPGPDVLRLKVALTGIKQSSPVLSGVTSIVPVGLVISAVKKGTTGSWTGSGATSAEIMAIDSSTNQVIGVAHDDQTAEFTERFSDYGSAEEAFKFWAERIRMFLDQAHGIK